MADDKIRENIRIKRKAFGETQEQLGEYLGYPKSMISMMENGKRDISIDMLKKLSLHYFTPMGDFTEANFIPEPDWKNLKISRLDEVKATLRMFPIVSPGFERIPDSFRYAVDLHERIIHDYCRIERTDEPDAVDEIEICREKYLVSLQFPELRIYAKANLVGLFLFLARGLIISIYSKDMPRSFLDKFYEEPQKVGKMYKENQQMFDMAISALRQEFISGKTGEYLTDLSESIEFADLAEYYQVWTYMLNLVPHNGGIVENCSRAKPLMDKLIKDGNPYLLDFMEIIYDALS